MKNFILLFVLSLCFGTLIYPQSWRFGNKPPLLPIYGGYMVDQNTMWVTGGTQSIYKSIDGGFTWVEKFQMDTVSYKSGDICFVNSTTGFVGGNYGKVLKTTDGGESWQIFTLPDSTSDDYNKSIHFFDPNLGFVLSNNNKTSRIYKTTDGGTTWTNLITITGTTMYSLDFSSPTNGIAVGTANNMYYTSDGTSWNKAPAPTFPPITYSRTDQMAVKFISPTSAVSCGWGSTAVGFEPTIFLKTTDAGATWAYMNQADQNRTYINFGSLYFKDSLNGIATGGASFPGTIICRTTDGGANWIPLPTQAGFSSKVVMGVGDKVIVAGSGGAVLSSTDFGNSWVNANPNTQETLSSINILNNIIYMCGFEGTFFKSTDMGNTFKMSYMVSGNKCIPSNGMQFLNENLAYAAGDRGQALKTNDAGVSWTQILLPDTLSNAVNNLGLYFINENVGFVVGKIASNVDIIRKTTDGGQSWTNVQNLVQQNLNCISFADDMHGAVGGNKSAMLYTTDQGVSWNTSVVNITDQLAIKAIKFYDGLNGIAVGQTIILKTSDGGATWNKVDFSFPATLYSVYCSGSIFYAAGDKYYVLKSTDNGNTWVNIMDTVLAKQNGFTQFNSIVTDNSGNLWTGGNSGLLTTAPVSGINNDAFKPNSFALNQNYPNPFNPSTVISFSLPEKSKISLKVYDVLGRIVEVLSDGVLNSGIHKINFNGKKFSSGIYIYTLATDKGDIISKKMVLLK
jgi:photosystem II stability/assembly factor-like uncharacterized protein